MNKSSKQHSKENSTTKYNPSNITSKSRQTIQSINLKLLKRSKKKLVSKYSVNQTFYPRKKINELIYNEDSLYACAFKEFLIYEDENEFLKKYYCSQAGKSKLRNITIFYDKYSKMFPNYIILPESNILYKNIQKKQKMIDKLQEMKKEEEKEKNKRNPRSSCDIFDTTAKNSILNESNSFMFNYQNIYNYNDEDNDNKSIEQIEKIHNIIDKADKLLESLSTRRGEENIINQKSKKFNIELIKLHNSPSPMQKSNAFLNNNQALSNVSLSNNINSTSSMLITKNNNNNSLDKAKAFEKKLNQNLSAIANINCLNIAHLKKNNIIPVIISSPRDDNSTVKSPRNSVLNKRILVHSQSHNGTFSQLNQKFTKKEIIGSNNNNNSSSNSSLLNNNTNNGSKIMGGNTYRKLQKNMLDIESLTQKSNKRRIDILKVSISMV